MTYITVKTPMVLPPKRARISFPQMSEDDLRKAMMRDPAAKRRFSREHATLEQIETQREIAARAAEARRNDPTTRANRIRVAMAGKPPMTAHEIADEIVGGDVTPLQVSNWCSHADEILKVGLKGKRALWVLAG